MEFLLDGFRAVTRQQGVMYLVGFALIYLAIQKDYEPALLLRGGGALRKPRFNRPHGHRHLRHRGYGA